MPSSEIAIRSASLPDKIEYAMRLADSGMLPAQYRKAPANILWAIEYGETLGLTPMAAITGVHVIEGKPSASAALISGLVRRAGHKLRVKGDANSATAQIIRTDDPDYVFEVTFTMQDARTAGLANKSVWKNYPAAMLKSRAITQVARDACEEILFGLHYTPEELGAEVDAEGEPMVVQQVRQEPQLTPQDAAEAVARKAQREMVDIAPRDQRNPFDPDFQLPAMPGTASGMDATTDQIRTIAILCREKHGISGNSKEARDARLAVIARIIRREIASSKGLTLREAQEVIESLTLEPPHVADLEVVDELASSLDPQLHADLAAAVEEADDPAAMDAVISSVEGAVAAGGLAPQQGDALLVAARERRGGWSHRVLAEQTGVAA